MSDIHPDIQAVLSGERRWCVVTGDCLDVLRVLPEKCVDAVVTDPPYGVSLKMQSTRHKCTKCSYRSFSDAPDATIALIQEATPHMRRIASCVILTPGTRMLQHYPPADDIGTVYFPTGAGAGKWGFNCNNPLIYYGACPYLKNRLGSRPNSTSATHWSRRKDAEHPCEKPVQWMEWMVKRATAFENNTVLDPFTGSGTTGVAAIKTGRRFIGIEIDGKYAEIARGRISAAENELREAS